LVVVFGLFAAPGLFAQTVDEIVAKNLEARGGRAALLAVKSLRMTGHAFGGPGREALVTREISRPGRIRTEFTFQGTTGVFIWDGKTGSRVSPLEGTLEPQPLSEDAAALSAEQADIEGPLVDAKAKGNRIELVGKADLPGGAAHELKVTLKSGVVRRVFVDAATGLVVKSESTRTLRGHELQFEVTYADFKKVGGVAFPHTLEMGVRGRPQRLKIVIDTVEVNPQLDEARFKPAR
jgi:hypothetical protein